MSLSGSKLLFFAAWALLYSPCLPVAQAGLVTFDDLLAVGCGGTNLPANYGGLTWTGWGYDNATISPCSQVGYSTALASTPNVAYNLGGGIQGAIDIISSSTPFELISGHFAAAFNDGLTITVVGKLFGTTVGTQNFTVTTTTQTLESFGFGPVTELQFFSAGGTPNPNLQGLGSGWYFGMDNLTTSVPESGTFSLFAVGILFVTIGLRLFRPDCANGA